jgi:transposase-like protein
VSRSEGYRPEDAVKATAMAADGATYQEIADALGVSLRTVHRWRRRHQEFEVALQEVRDAVDDEVEAALVEAAVGGEYEEEVATPKGDVVTIKRKRHADGQSARWWLANRRPKEFSLNPRGARKALDFRTLDGSAKSLVDAGLNVLRLMAAGELSVEEGQAAATVIAACSRAPETGELEARLAELEGTSQKLLTHE